MIPDKLPIEICKRVTPLQHEWRSDVFENVRVQQRLAQAVGEWRRVIRFVEVSQGGLLMVAIEPPDCEQFDTLPPRKTYGRWV